jgi:glycosyltransferase involved in cell wall biosynthesis
MQARRGTVVRPTVSVVIATRNRCMLLSEAIATVLDQSFTDWELIVVDDASTDGTAEYLTTLRDNRIRALIQEARAERSAARNRGLETAHGEFVMFLDDDDMLRSDALLNLVRALTGNPTAVAATGPCRILQVSGDSVKVYFPFHSSTRHIWRELLSGWWANSGQNLYRTATVREAGGFDPAAEVCEDRKLWLNVARRGPVCLVPQVAMDYRLHAGQSKPPNVDDVRKRVWSEFVASLPHRDRRQAIRTREAAEFVDRAMRARERREFGSALWLQVRACVRAPWLVSSPLTGRPMWWAVKKALIRSSQR